MSERVTRAIADQAAFRAVMQAMARPGRVQPLPGLEAPAPLSPGAAALLRALADGDTPVWLDPPLAAVGDVADWIAFHCGAPVVEASTGAAFAVFADPAGLSRLDLFTVGEADYPDRSATLILQVETFHETPFVLSGPGINGSQGFGAAPLPAGFGGSLVANHGLYPRGLDFMFVAPAGVAGLPRSTRIEEH